MANPINTTNLDTVLTALNYANAVLCTSTLCTTESSRKANITELFGMDKTNILNPFSSIEDRIGSIGLDCEDLADEDDDAISMFMTLVDTAITNYIAGEAGAFSVSVEDYKNDVNGNDHVKWTIQLSDGTCTLTIPVILITYRDSDTWNVEESSYNEHVSWTLSSPRSDSENGLLIKSIKDGCKESIVDFLIERQELDCGFENIPFNDEVEQAKETISLYEPVAALADKLLITAISREF